MGSGKMFINRKEKRVLSALLKLKTTKIKNHFRANLSPRQSPPSATHQSAACHLCSRRQSSSNYFRSCFARGRQHGGSCTRKMPTPPLSPQCPSRRRNSQSHTCTNSRD